MDINSNLLAPCGLYCGVCGVYYATRDKNNKFMAVSYTHLTLPTIQL